MSEHVSYLLVAQHGPILIRGTLVPDSVLVLNHWLVSADKRSQSMSYTYAMIAHFCWSLDHCYSFLRVGGPEELFGGLAKFLDL